MTELPFCTNVNTEAPLPTRNAMMPGGGAPGTGLHNPVIPCPSGTLRSHTGTWGRNSVAVASTVTFAGVSPGELTSTVMRPDFFSVCTSPMQ